MKKITILVFFILFSLGDRSLKAQVPLADVIKAALVKIIKAIDLEVQRQQNKIIWLQNAQKSFENTMSKAKLTEISGWVNQQRDLYSNYYQELGKVKSFISYYQRVKDIYNKQMHLLDSYHKTWNLLRQDKHFREDEISAMSTVYAGILDESVKNIDQIFLVLQSFQTRMSDAARLELINKAADRVESNYFDLQRFNEQNVLLSLNRARDYNDMEVIKKFYGF